MKELVDATLLTRAMSKKLRFPCTVDFRDEKNNLIGQVLLNKIHDVINGDYPDPSEYEYIFPEEPIEPCPMEMTINGC